MPTAVIDGYIKSTGDMGQIRLVIQSTSEAIPTSNVKLVTSWSTTNKSSTAREGISGGATVISPLPKDKANANYTSAGTETIYNAPIGYGTGIDPSIQQKTSGTYPAEQWYGNYTLKSGTTIQATAQTPVPTDNDAMEAILGDNWENLRTGDTVTVRLIHTPTGGSICQKTLVVQ